MPIRIFRGQSGIRTHTPFRTYASKAQLSRQFQHLAIIITEDEGLELPRAEAQRFSRARPYLLGVILHDNLSDE